MKLYLYCYHLSICILIIFAFIKNDLWWSNLLYLWLSYLYIYFVYSIFHVPRVKNGEWRRHNYLLSFIIYHIFILIIFVLTNCHICIYNSCILFVFCIVFCFVSVTCRELRMVSGGDTISLWPQQNLWYTRAPHITEKIDSQIKIDNTNTLKQIQICTYAIKNTNNRWQRCKFWQIADTKFSKYNLTCL